VRLCEVAIALLKVAPYDLGTMGCTGLQRYFTQVVVAGSLLNIIIFYYF
jgi:hypothetical protein